MKIHHFEQLESTNTTAMEARYKHAEVITAEHQTNGRGQRGNVWAAAKGANLTFSIVVEPLHLKAWQQFVVSMVAALSVKDLLAEYKINAKLKWPNDIYVNNHKIAGILIEHLLMGGEELSKSVIGIGLNINQRHFPPMAVEPTSLALELNVHETLELDKAEVLNRLLLAFQSRYSQTPTQLHSDYITSLWRADGSYPYRDTASGETFKATIHNVDPLSGMLTLQCDNSDLRTYFFKEVEPVRE